MTDIFFLIFLVLIIYIFIVIIVKLASFFRRFAEKTRIICHKMDRADTYDDYLRWRGELRCHYLSLIPFVTKKNVKKLYNLIYHRADREQKERKDSIAPLMLPSLLGICLCLVCVSGMTWAWYTASIETATQNMEAACYEVTVESVVAPDNKVIEVVNGSCVLEAGKLYTVKLNASGTVKDCGGYCLIENASGDKIYTVTFNPAESITVQFTSTTAGVYTFTGVWGSLPVGTEITTKSVVDNPVTNPVTEHSTVSASTEPANQPSEVSSEPEVSTEAPTSEPATEPVSSEDE